MPLPKPTDGPTTRMVKRLRTLMDADDTHQYFTGAVRKYPPSDVSKVDEIIVSLHVSDDDTSVETLNSWRANPRVLLTVMAHCSEAGTEAAIYEQLQNVTDALKEALWQWRAGPPVAPRDWHSLRFLGGNGGEATTEYKHLQGKYFASSTAISLKSQQRNPQPNP